MRLSKMEKCQALNGAAHHIALAEYALNSLPKTMQKEIFTELNQLYFCKNTIQKISEKLQKEI